MSSFRRILRFGARSLCWVLLLVTGCTEDAYSPSDSKLVVEGWIDAGGYPCVMLSRSLEVSSERQSLDELSDFVIRWGKVVVSDGEKEVVLTGRYDRSYYPPFIYTTTDMKGVAGRTYHLTAEYEDMRVEAVTTIPAPVAVDSFVVRRNEGSADRVNVTAYFTDPEDTKDYYEFFVNTDYTKKSTYLSCFLGAVDDAVVRNPVGVPVHAAEDNTKTENSDFKEGDVVLIKFARVDQQSFTIWNDFERLQSLSRNNLFKATQSLHTNIQGGLGYWCGYGATEYLLQLIPR